MKLNHEKSETLKLDLQNIGLSSVFFKHLGALFKRLIQCFSEFHKHKNYSFNALQRFLKNKLKHHPKIKKYFKPFTVETGTRITKFFGGKQIFVHYIFFHLLIMHIIAAKTFDNHLHCLILLRRLFNLHKVLALQIL